MIGTYKLLYTIALLFFGIMFLLYGIAGLTWDIGFMLVSSSLLVYTGCPLLLAFYTLELDKYKGKKHALLNYGWLLGLIGVLLGLVGLVIISIWGYVIIMSIAFIIAVFIPAIGILMSKKALGLSMVELLGAIMGIIYPILFLVTAILMLARATAGNIVLVITAIFALIWALLEVVAVFMYK